jgi:hypothetical protein
MAKSVLSQLKQAKTKKYATIGLQVKRLEKLTVALEKKQAQAKRLKQAVETFEKRMENHAYSICFGSKKLLASVQVDTSKPHTPQCRHKSRTPR